MCTVGNRADLHDTQGMLLGLYFIKQFALLRQTIQYMNKLRSLALACLGKIKGSQGQRRLWGGVNVCDPVGEHEHPIASRD